jgi:hypothetical protein
MRNGIALALTCCAISFQPIAACRRNCRRRETVSIDRNIANDFEFVVTASSLFVDSGSWLFRILTVIWGS